VQEPEWAGPELNTELIDIAVDGQGAVLTQFVPAETPALHGDTSDPSGPGGSDVPDAVADSQGTGRIDPSSSHGLDEHCRVRLRPVHVVGGRDDVDSVPRAQNSQCRLDLVCGRRRGEHNSQRGVVGPVQQTTRPGKRTDLGRQRLVAVGPGDRCLTGLVTKKRGNQLIASHPHQSVDGIHGSPLTGLSEGTGPSEGVQVIRIDQRPVQVEQDAGPSRSVDHLGPLPQVDTEKLSSATGIGRRSAGYVDPRRPTEVHIVPRNDPGPSVKDKEQYEAIRRQGASKEKAARIANASANTSRSATGHRGGASPAYEEWSRSDLYDRAKQIGVGGRSQMSKSELIDALRNH
jgi:hypothetical protein